MDTQKQSFFGVVGGKSTCAAVHPSASPRCLASSLRSLRRSNSPARLVSPVAFFLRVTSASSALRYTLRLLRLAADTGRRAGRVVAGPLNVRRTDARRVPAAVSGLSRCAAGALLREAAGGRGDE